MSLAWAEHPLLLLVNVLAAFRLTRLVVDDAVPFGVLRGRLIDWANDRWLPRVVHDEPGQRTEKQRRQFHAYEGTAPLGYLVSCYWCAGLWISGLVALLASTGPWWLIVAVPLALSAAVGILARAAD